MTGFGMVLLALAFIAVLVWIFEARKAGKIQRVPFRTVSQIAQGGPGAADAKGLVSCEGAIEGQPIIAPMSGQPCLYWEVEITREWEKHSTNSQGQPTKSSGSTSVSTDKGGGVFALSDGAARVMLDCTKKPDSDLKTSHQSTIPIGMMIPNELHFGNLRAQVPPFPRGESVKAFAGREKIIPFVAGQTMFALGKLTQGQHGPTLAEDGSMFGSLMVSDKNRETTLGKSVKNAKIGKIAGLSMAGVGAALCVAGFLFEKPAQASSEPPAQAQATDSSSLQQPSLTSPNAQPTHATATHAAPAHTTSTATTAPSAPASAPATTSTAKASSAPATTAAAKAPAKVPAKK